MKSPFIENGEQPINSEPKQEAYSGRAPKERESEWDKSIPLENRKPGWGYSNPNISTVPGNDPRAGGGRKRRRTKKSKRSKRRKTNRRRR